ncbi:MAG: response regulator [Candidatus Parvarchaeota archaeon]|nr:response regulator [Candidatus Jingweiarchaeum tengchongense]
MVIDDDPSIRKILYRILSSKGFEVILSTDPLNALTLLKNNLPQFVILDRDLPFLSGDEFLRKIKIIQPSVKIIILTGYDDIDSRNKLLSEGADLFLSKSTSITSLVEEIYYFINKNTNSDLKERKKVFKILIVDDEENIRKMLSRFLFKKGFDVLTSTNGLEAYEIIKKNDVDIIFLDIFMPEMNGEEFIDLALKIKPDLKIIVISGDTQDLALKMLKKGAFDYLQKPINFNRLENLVRIICLMIE